MTGRAPATVLLACVLVGGLRAQRLIARVNPGTVTVGQTLRYSLSIEGAEGRTAEPAFPEQLEVLGSTSSQSITMVNGRVSQVTTVLYSLRALKAGTVVIPPVKAVTRGGGSMLSEAVRIEVSPPAPPGKRPGDQNEEPLFLEVGLTPRAVYLGEPLALHARVYLREGFRHARPPQAVDGRFDGFRVDQQEFDNTQGSWVTLKTGRYTQFDVDRKILVPLEAGEFTVIPGGAVVSVNRDEPGFRLGFRNFFNPQSQQVQLETDAQVVKVFPIPEAGRPADYAGVVGRDLELQVKADRSEVEVGTPVHLEIVVSGRADLRGLRELPLTFPSAVTVFETKGTHALTWRPDGPESRAAFEMVLVPSRPGPVQLPAVQLAWFDAEAGRFARLEAPGPRLVVTGELPHPQAPRTALARTVQGPSVEAGADRRALRFLREEAGEFPLHRPPLHARTDGLLILGGLLLLGAGLELWARHRERFAGDAAGLRASRACRQARSTLAALLEAGDARDFYGQLGAALREYVAAKARRETGGLRGEEIAGILEDHQVPAELVQQGSELLARIEEARYAKVAAATPGRDKVLAQGWIEKVERSFR